MGQRRDRRTCRGRLVQTFAGNLAAMLEAAGTAEASSNGVAAAVPEPRAGGRGGECLRARGDRRPGDGRAAGVRPDAARRAAHARAGGRRVCRWASWSRASCRPPVGSEGALAGAGIFAMICLVIGYLVDGRAR